MNRNSKAAKTSPENKSQLQHTESNSLYYKHNLYTRSLTRKAHEEDEEEWDEDKVCSGGHIALLEG